MGDRPSDEERRRHPRFDLLAQVRVKRSQTDLLMELTNISRSGALVDMGTLPTPSWVDVGRVIEVSIVHPDSLDNIEVEARVVRISKDESGTLLAVQFDDLEDDTQRKLDSLVEYARATPRPPPLPKS
jgi:c-di-GMP-binding flagellar brake protein YcgR